MSASIGIAVSPQDGPDATTLLRRADMAMYAAKRERCGFLQYAPEHDGYSPERLALVGDLRGAIENGELTLHFQPQVELRTRPRHGYRSAGALDPSAAGPDRAGRVHPARRTHRPDQTADPLGAGRRPAGMPRLAECGLGAHRVGECLVHDLYDSSFPEMVAELLAKHAVPLDTCGSR